MHARAAHRQTDAITLEVLRNALDSIAEEMGETLRLTSFSANIKERMDASCAVFDAKAELIAQAEHVPVHIGSMARALSATIADLPPLDEGDVVIANDPFVAGAHLPDILLMAPVFVDSRLIAYVATRAHHADVGGMEPGSMPGNSRTIFQEGLIIPTVRLFRKGVLQEEVLRIILANVRTPEERRGDLSAQLASLRIGERRIKEVAERYGLDTLVDGFRAILDYAERRMRHALRQLPTGTYEAEDQMDDDGAGSGPVIIKVKVTVSDDNMRLDFSGTSPQVSGNINAVAPMTYSAIFFALKVMVDATVPVNGGTFRPIQVHLPEGCVLNAQWPAAVCAGNTEMPQRIVDTLFKAFAAIAPERIPAASQGTMNSISIGGRDPRTGTLYAYIETVGGGQGGRPMGVGQDGIQCNMTNTRNTPIEALEITYPLRIERYELREGSSGAGKHRGGLGLIRAIRVLNHDALVSITSDRRVSAPYGLGGGADGASGRNLVIRSDGREEPQPGKVALELHAGDTVIVETPGGGGWGAP